MVGTWDNTSIVSILYHSQYQVCTYLISGKKKSLEPLPGPGWYESVNNDPIPISDLYENTQYKYLTNTLWKETYSTRLVMTHESWWPAIFFWGKKISKRQLHIRVCNTFIIKWGSQSSPNHLILLLPSCSIVTIIKP